MCTQKVRILGNRTRISDFCVLKNASMLSLSAHSPSYKPWTKNQMEQKTHQNNSHIPHIQDDELLDEIMQLAAHFEGKLPETGEELFDYYCLLGRKVFDTIDSDQDGEGQTARQTHRQVDG